MKERQRWRAEEDALLRAYVKQHGPRDWHLVSQRMNHTLNRDPKSCLERWKNYLKPGIKKGTLTEDEQRLVIRLQAKHGNKWKKIASEVPGRTAKRLGKWWEVFREKQQKESKNTATEPIEDGRYDRILETFAEKLANEPRVTMPSSNNGPGPPPALPSVLPPWMTASTSPSVALTLSPLTGPPARPGPWLQPPCADRLANHNNLIMGNLINNNNNNYPVGESNNNNNNNNNNDPIFSELAECCRELEEGQRAWAAHRKEATWRLKRVELQLESEKANRRREKMEEIEAKVKALRDEQKATLDRIESEYREQLAGLRREAEMKEQKLAEQWAAKHSRLNKFLEQMACRSIGGEPNGR